jgi:hypothetical protein
MRVLSNKREVRQVLRDGLLLLMVDYHLLLDLLMILTDVADYLFNNLDLLLEILDEF